MVDQSDRSGYLLCIGCGTYQMQIQLQHQTCCHWSGCLCWLLVMDGSDDQCDWMKKYSSFATSCGKWAVTISERVKGRLFTVRRN